MRTGPYRYSVFMSYAHDDDTGWADWITHFDSELTRGLQSRLRELEPPETHLSSRNGPINGPLGGKLKRAVEQSYAMVIFVHDGYLRSDWCLQELQYFRELHGEQAFRERFFIVAMSERAVQKLTMRPEWVALFGSSEPVWMPFFNTEAGLTDQPLELFLRVSRGTQAVMSNEFLRPFFRLREQLVQRIRDEADLNPDLFDLSADEPEPAPVPGDTLEVLTYIESEPGEESYWEPLGRQVSQAWDQVVALEPREPALLLRPTGLPMHDLRNRPRLDNADGVILLWGQKTQESLLAQIELVEPKLSAPNLAPGLIAYLVEVGSAEAGQSVPPSLMNWPVVRFATRRGDRGTAVAVDQDEARLRRFLRQVLDHKRRARALPVRGTGV